MHPKVFFKLAWLRTLNFLLKTGRWVVSIVVIAILSFLLISPVVLGTISTLQGVGRTNQLFGGSIILLWLASSALVFVPMLISVIVRTIQNNKKLKNEKKDSKTE